MMYVFVWCIDICWGALLNKAWKGGKKQDGTEGEAELQYSFNRRHWYSSDNCPPGREIQACASSQRLVIGFRLCPKRSQFPLVEDNSGKGLIWDHHYSPLLPTHSQQLREWVLQPEEGSWLYPTASPPVFTLCCSDSFTPSSKLP